MSLVKILTITAVISTLTFSALAGEWVCKETVENKSGTIDISRCPGRRSVACYEDIKEICVEKKSGDKVTKEYRVFTGQCVSSYGDCWW